MNPGHAFLLGAATATALGVVLSYVAMWIHWRYAIKREREISEFLAKHDPIYESTTDQKVDELHALLDAEA